MSSRKEIRKWKYCEFWSAFIVAWLDAVSEVRQIVERSYRR